MSEQQNIGVRKIELCRSLRWKSIYGRETVTEPELRELFAVNEVPYSCLRTAQPWGPDDEIAAPERCCSGRACFVASPRLVRGLV